MAAAKFTDRTVRALTEPGRYGDGGNLWLQVRDVEHRSWLLRYSSPSRFGTTGKPLAREMGLGPYPDVTLAKAREKAAEARAMLRDGIDPLEDRKVKREVLKAAQTASQWTFARVVDDYLTSRGAEHGGNKKHQQQWRQTLALAVSTFGTKHVADITKGDVEELLRPIWATKTETAKRLRGRVEQVLSYATFKGWRTGDNPARWRDNLKHALPRPSKIAKTEHHPALPVPVLPAFMVALRSMSSVAARALEFTVLTAARSGETLGATWSEIDLEGAVWTIPKERMKAKAEHRVALSPDAVTVLRGMLPMRSAHGEAGGLVFPSRDGMAMSNMAMTALLRRMNGLKTGAAPRWCDTAGRPIVPHGFRSTFRVWAGETTSHPPDVVEQALAHKLGDKVAQAYDRGDRFQKRRVLMADWAAFCAKPDADVVTLAERRG